MHKTFIGCMCVWVCVIAHNHASEFVCPHYLMIIISLPTNHLMLVTSLHYDRMFCCACHIFIAMSIVKALHGAWQAQHKVYHMQCMMLR